MISTMAATAPSWRSSIISSTGALLQVSLCCGLLTMVSPSSICPSVTFNIFDISIRIVSMMDATAAILKVFNCYLLPNCKSDGAETCWKALGQLGDLKLLKWFCLDIQDGHMAAILKIFKSHLLPNGVWLSLNLMGGCYGDSELLKSF